ncbi:glutamate-1-semialdehyde 2,1-aminomutase [Caloramator proteoclasticus]|uniref:Glutamate-1-semialdehyde 2,1-aminomutase n=1 Tax=Caloramator proteoclasticus DSM 10124 TaxID=1121262 RepID=A0A1M4S9M0_9CLOT|nr:glutamate-1-semialdehyde 2,1-aminomutase [Caloramator proteoclasticus]SHE28914.1 glutamate-1-semialdehyde 2,1-aminomutase [Caloramator proteoclasticus DSM 10124]
MNNLNIFNESKRYMPGGVNSPVRAFTGLNINPPVIKSGKGAYIYDEEGKKYIDFVLAWGPMILGHSDEEVVEEAIKTLREAQAFGAPTYLELELAKLICDIYKIDMIRMVNSGTEATMSAVKLARGYTNRDKVVKFSGCYHGHFDAFLVAAGSGVMTENIPGSAGVPKDSIKNTIIANYNDIENVKEVFEKWGEEIACVIVEPVAGNMGVVPATMEFLNFLREITNKYGSLLIFDEVMTGFRVALGGAKELYGIQPDLVTFAKIIGGGLPCGAYGGRREIMEMLSPIGSVYQAGTMSGNPVVVSMGLATLKKLKSNGGYYEQLEQLSSYMHRQIEVILNNKSIPFVINRCGSMMTVFFTEENSVKNYEDAKKCNIDLYRRYAEHMITNGIYLSPSQFEAMFLSVKHTKEDIEIFLDVLKRFH